MSVERHVFTSRLEISTEQGATILSVMRSKEEMKVDERAWKARSAPALH